MLWNSPDGGVGVGMDDSYPHLVVRRGVAAFNVGSLGGGASTGLLKGIAVPPSRLGFPQRWHRKERGTGTGTGRLIAKRFKHI